MRKLLAVGLVAGGLAGLLWAKDFWQQKDYPQWSAKECNRLLSQSPWAHPYALTGLLIPAPMNQAGGDAEEGETRIGGGFEAGDREVHLVLQIRFLTARSLRAAVGRLRLLQNPDQPGLPGEVDAYVSQDDPPEIAVELTWFSRPEGHPLLREVEGFFRDTNLEQLRTRCYLSSSETGVFVAPKGFTGPARGYPGVLLTFPRFDDQGGHYFNGSEKTLLFRLEARFGAIEQTFNPRKMVWRGGFTL